jgi:hypothetical protein
MNEALGDWCFSTRSPSSPRFLVLGEEARRLRRFGQLVFHTSLLEDVSAFMQGVKVLSR